MRHSHKSAHSSILVPFLVLPENRFAFEAISSIGEGTPRPVYLHGPSGTGKSHLVRHAVRSFLSKRPDARVQHLTAGEFAAEFADASSAKTISLFQSATREFDVFVLEDLQALDRRPETQVQLLALYNDLTAAGCQVIWTSRSSPGDLGGFLKKLVSRFRGGVLAQMRPLELESRIRLLNHFAAFQHLALPADAAEVLAAGMDVSPRDLWAVCRRNSTPIPGNIAARSIPIWCGDFCGTKSPRRGPDSTTSAGPSPGNSASASASCGRESSRGTSFSRGNAPCSWHGNFPAEASSKSGIISAAATTAR